MEFEGSLLFRPAISALRRLSGRARRPEGNCAHSEHTLRDACEVK